MKRNLILDENDLVMVVKQDVVQQIDEYRGELTRTEFVNHLIHCQLKQFEEKTQYVRMEDFNQFTGKMAELIHTFMDCVISRDLNHGDLNGVEDMAELNRQLEAILGSYPPDHKEE